MRPLTHKISGGLSAKRRSRLAAPAVLLIALLMAGGLYSLLAPADAAGVKDDASSIAKGRALFLVGCASCHGKNAQGILTERNNNYGPSLIGVGAAAVDFQVGTGRMPMAQPGAQALAKKPVYDKAEISALAAYVASLGPGPNVPDAQDYDYSAVDNEGMVAGGEFFRTNCTACHNYAGAGGALPEGKFAPNLRDVSAKHIYEALLTGPQQMPVFSNGNLTPQTKREIIAYLKKNNETPSYGGFSLGSLGPVSEGFAAWLIGIGACVGFAIWIAAHTARSSRKKGTAQS